jgi:hypothetical protein
VTPALDATKIVAVLNSHSVHFVVIGAFAAIAHQAPIPATRQIELTPDAHIDNLNRLSAALQELGARVRAERLADGLVFENTGTALGDTEVWNLTCGYGEFDISFHPSGFIGGYRQFAAQAHAFIVGDQQVSIADLGDVIKSKEAAGRPKDLQVLPILYRHLRALKAARQPAAIEADAGQSPLRGPL